MGADEYTNEGAKPIRAMPGPGGSLGECGVCGKSFAFEILTGQHVRIVGHPDLQQDFPVHQSCHVLLEQFNESHDWHMLPDGPLRKVFELNAERVRTLDEARQNELMHASGCNESEEEE
jgi:hypothetical protein